MSIANHEISNEVGAVRDSGSDERVRLSYEFGAVVALDDEGVTVDVDVYRLASECQDCDVLKMALSGQPSSLGKVGSVGAKVG